MSERKEKHNPGLVTISQCEAAMTVVKTEINSVRLDMVGIKEDTKSIKAAIIGDKFGEVGGLVKDMQDLKEHVRLNKTAMDWIKPIIIAAVSSLIVFGLTKLFGV